MILIKRYSLEQLFSRDIDPLIEGLEPDSDTKQIFSFKNPNIITPVFTRSTTCWAKNIDTSPISVWNDNTPSSTPFNAGGYKGSGTLISPRHIIYANHFRFYDGTTFIFVDMNNNCYTRTLQSSLQIAGTDIRIGLLDSDITEVSFAKILALDISEQTNDAFKLPALFTDQERNALIGEYYFSLTNGFCLPPESFRSNFYETPILGDSGNPISLVYKNKMLLTFTFFSALAGPSLSFFINEINSTMNILGGGYTAITFGMKDVSANAEKGRLNTLRGPNKGIAILSEIIEENPV